MAYDSKADTLEHIRKVSQNLNNFSKELLVRANIHDESKLHSPEKELFDELTPRLSNMTYGSDEYKASLKELEVALDHHYANNSHHPQFVEFNELWMDISGYVGIYQISSRGRVKRLSTIIHRESQGDFIGKEMIMKAHVTPKGYARIRLQTNNIGKNFFIHSLVANAFLPSPPNDRYQVNHKNGRKLENYIENLEWLTPSENLQHAYDTGLATPNVKYVVQCNELDFITFGTEKMEKELISRGYLNASSAGIWRCITSDDPTNTHLDLTFKSWNIDEYRELNSPVSDMTLQDIVEMYCDWKAAIERTKDGDFNKSLEINEKRFSISPQLIQIFRNTYERG